MCLKSLSPCVLWCSQYSCIRAVCLCKYAYRHSETPVESHEKGREEAGDKGALPYSHGRSLCASDRRRLHGAAHAGLVDNHFEAGTSRGTLWAFVLPPKCFKPLDEYVYSSARFPVYVTVFSITLQRLAKPCFVSRPHAFHSWLFLNENGCTLSKWDNETYWTLFFF